MRRLISTAILALTVVAVFAVPAKRGMWRTVTTADGMKLKVELTGDEFGHYWQAADGRCFTENMQTGLFEAVNKDDVINEGTARRAKANEARKRRSPRSGMPQGAARSSYTGNKKGLIILVSFADMPFKPAHTNELYNNIANAENFTNDMGFVGSVHDYFLSQSYGTFNLTFDVIGPVAMPENYAYYGANVNGNDNTAVIGQMVKDACQAVANEVNFSDYDWDGDGEVDQVFILYAGRGEASGGDANTIWPHEFSLTGATGSNLKIGNMIIDTYACGCELGLTGGIDGIGTICHEFSHCLGLPDMYDTNTSLSSSSRAFGLGDWSLMSSGSYNNYSFTPAGYTSYEKMVSGWITPTVLENNCRVSGMKGIDGTPEAYIIYNDNNENEYYLLENHDGAGWDKGLPGSGMLILHVDYDPYVWMYNIVNSPSRQGGSNGHQRCTLIPADNQLNGSGDANDLWPYRYFTSLTNTSTPAAELYNANTNGAYFMNKPIRDIAKADDGTISFNFENDNILTDDYVLPQSYLFYESFDQCAGKGGNDGSFNANTTGKPVYDNEDWTSPSSVQADRCARYGSSMIGGQAVTPTININGEYYLWFKAAPYTGDNLALTIEVAEGTAELGRTEFLMSSGSWSAFNTTLKADGPVRLRFKTGTGKGRFYLDKVCVTNENVTTGITDVNMSGTMRPAHADNHVYSIDGRRISRGIDNLSPGIYIVNGKKFIKK